MCIPVIKGVYSTTTNTEWGGGLEEEAYVLVLHLYFVSCFFFPELDQIWGDIAQIK